MEGRIMLLENKKIVVSGGFIKTASVEQEWEEDLENPAAFIGKIRESGIKADLFTFWQRVPNTKPIYDYYMEWDDMAVVPIKDFKYWWEKQIDAKNRNVARKAEKRGVVIKVVDYTDDYVRGIMGIYNETPVRQGKAFWHYGKDFETVKIMNGTYLNQSEFIGAYLNGELIGFLKLIYGDNTARTVQILSKMEHRDKAPTNALLAKAIELCEKRKIGYLVYAHWAEGSLGEFKRNNGFEKIELPRYYVPLNLKGRIALKLGIHHGAANMIPDNLKVQIKKLRAKWHERKLMKR
jgi:hypothetical protein